MATVDWKDVDFGMDHLLVDVSCSRSCTGRIGCSSSGRLTDAADSDRGMPLPTGFVYVADLKGGGREPVGLTERLFLRLER